MEFARMVITTYTTHNCRTCNKLNHCAICPSLKGTYMVGGLKAPKKKINNCYHKKLLCESVQYPSDSVYIIAIWRCKNVKLTPFGTHGDSEIHIQLLLLLSPIIHGVRKFHKASQFCTITEVLQDHCSSKYLLVQAYRSVASLSTFYNLSEVYSFLTSWVWQSKYQLLSPN